jgi:DNA invertase Pin-like site-specific DNA recombinase
MKKYIAYYRVSTKKQGNSGLGLAAQKNLVSQHIGSDELVGEYQEVETGKNSNRPQLLKAIAECRNTGSTLIIAKLDRLSRNAAFTLTLQDSGIDFICADFPQANSLTIGLLAVLAQDEAKRISERTTSSLGVIKERLEKGIRHISKSGAVVTKLGSPQNLTSIAIQKGCEVRKKKAFDNPESRKAGAFIIALRNQGVGFKQITTALNDSGFKAPKGGLFNETQTQRMYNRYK